MEILNKDTRPFGFSGKLFTFNSIYRDLFIVHQFAWINDKLYTVRGIDGSRAEETFDLRVVLETDPMVIHLAGLGFNRHPREDWGKNIYQAKVKDRTYKKYLRIHYPFSKDSKPNYISCGYSEYRSGAGGFDLFQGYIDNTDEMDMLLHFFRFQLDE